MREDIAGPRGASSRPMWETLEGMVREKAQEFIQQIMEEEVTELLGREKSERRRVVDAAEGYRNGYGKPRRLAMSSGTITLPPPSGSGTRGAVREPGAAAVLAEDQRGGCAAPGAVPARSGGRELRACDERPAGRGGSVVEVLDSASEEVLEEELKAMVGARRFERVGSRKDHRNGTYLRRLLTSLGQIDVMVPRSREGKRPQFWMFM